MSEPDVSPVACLREYLQIFAAQSTPDQCFEVLLSQIGTEYPSPSHQRPKGFRKMRTRGCFMNSFRAAQSKGWTYVEGYGLSVDPLFPVHHAW